MTAWRLLGCWIGALLAAAAFLALAARDPDLPKPDLAGVDVVVIGTSLVHRAIPASGTSGELLPDRGPHARIGLPSSSREEILEVLDHASREQPSTILLEANPLIFALSGHAANLDCPALACMLRRTIALERRRYSAGLRSLLGVQSAEQLRMEMATSEPSSRH